MDMLASMFEDPSRGVDGDCQLALRIEGRHGIELLRDVVGRRRASQSIDNDLVRHDVERLLSVAVAVGEPRIGCKRTTERPLCDQGRDSSPTVGEPEKYGTQPGPDPSAPNALIQDRAKLTAQ